MQKFSNTDGYKYCNSIKATQEQCSCKVVTEREKIKAVSNPVWACWKAMIEEKTIKEE